MPSCAHSDRIGSAWFEKNDGWFKALIFCHKRQCDEGAAEEYAMSWISWICFGICFLIALSTLRRGADVLSPSRVFGFIWSFSIGLTDLKFSALQGAWNLESWLLLLTGIGAFLVGTLIVQVLNLETKLLPLSTMRESLRGEKIHETRLFWFICLSVAVYSASYLVIFLVRGFLPIFVVGTKISRVEFFIYGLGLLINSTAFIIFFTLLYYLYVRGKRVKKTILAILSVLAVGSYFLLLQRFQIVMAVVISFALLYYATNFIRVRTVLLFSVTVIAFFYWITLLRYRHLELVTMFLYSASKMKFPTQFAALTEPYMYVVMNLENFSRAVNRLDHHTYGYFSFDFIAAITGLKYWISDYFGIDRTPYLFSSYNTYTAFWSFYRDFGVGGLVLIPLALGFSVAALYHRMRNGPTIKNVTAYGVMVFVMRISFFVFPIAFIWFEYNMLALYWILRWTIMPRAETVE